MSLACGGRGPCCHIGYPHRHCDHCDVVVPTQGCHHQQHYYYGGWQPNWAGYYPGVYGNTMLAQQMNTLAGSQLSAGLQALSNQVNAIEYPEK